MVSSNFSIEGSPYTRSPVRKVAANEHARFFVKGAESDSSDDDEACITAEKVRELSHEPNSIFAQVKFCNTLGLRQVSLKQNITLDREQSRFDSVIHLKFQPNECIYFSYNYEGRYSPISLRVKDTVFAKFSLYTERDEDVYSLDNRLKLKVAPVSNEEFAKLKGVRRRLFQEGLIQAEPSALSSFQVAEKVHEGCICKILEIDITLHIA